jgi:2-dehydro-3-deoxy-D-arabinonate dehydratase
MKLYNTLGGCFVEQDNKHYLVDAHSWDQLILRPDLHDHLARVIATEPPHLGFNPDDICAPIGHQEVWAAGVTYYRSRGARMEESKDSGGGTFYDRVYSAERPELFFKSTAHRTVGPGGKVRIRKDASWSVPEPELTLLASPAGKIIGYTIGNDMSSRDIEGENPLYLPQAKVYSGSCALGPCVLLTPDPLSSSTEIELEILRNGEIAFSGSIGLTELKRDPQSLVDYLFRDNSFPSGVYLMTGTGIVPPGTFTLAHGDTIRIAIQPIGVLENEVA